MYHTDVTTPGTLRLLLARTTPGPQRSRAESKRLLLARDNSWPVTPACDTTVNEYLCCKGVKGAKFGPIFHTQFVDK